LKPGDVVIGVLAGAQQTKVRPAVVIASDTCLVERPDVLIGILTTKFPRTLTSTDYVLSDWQSAGLRAMSCFRMFVLTMHRSELTIIGHLTAQDWNGVKGRIRAVRSILRHGPLRYLHLAHPTVIVCPDKG
jgi:hypothetical protein